MEKRLKRNKIVIALAVIAGLLLVYCCYSAYSAYAYMNSYYSSYGMSVTDDIGTAIGYILQSSLQYLVYAVIVGACLAVLQEVRKLNPDNFEEVPVKEKNAKEAVAAAVAEVAEKAEEAKEAVEEEEEEEE